MENIIDFRDFRRTGTPVAATPATGFEVVLADLQRDLLGRGYAEAAHFVDCALQSVIECRSGQRKR
jgi:hypothetical protein